MGVKVTDQLLTLEKSRGTFKGTIYNEGEAYALVLGE